MRIFRCDRCGSALYFENWRCLRCGSVLAFLPDVMDLGAIEPAPDPQAAGLWRRPHAADSAPGRRWRLCRHHANTHVCNFAIPVHDPHPLCVSCRQTRVLPDLSQPGNVQRWYRLEVAKRRLFFTLVRLGLIPADPFAGAARPSHDTHTPNPHTGGAPDLGPVYEFLADLPGQPVPTGHARGVVTVNIAEADDDERMRRRITLHEPYRTLLGHLRHESGHYYWDRLVGGTPALPAFRALFGDERSDYALALQAHYARGTAGGQAPAEGPEGFVSVYATAHPWEDWAETWAHYLHMIDLLETAASFETQLRAPPARPPTAGLRPPHASADGPGDFDALVARWVPLTLLVNSLNRSLGHGDAYPFALGPGVQAKLRFVHDRIATGLSGPRP